MITKLNPEVIQEGSITADKINIESLKTDSGFVTEDSLTNKIGGKGLSTEDFTTALKTKLEGLSNYDDTTLSNALSTLRGDFDKLVSGDTTTAIKTFNEVIAFLDGLTDTQDLESIIASIEQQIAGKADDTTALHKAGEETITGVKTFNGRVNFLGSGDSNAMYLSTNTRLNVDGTTNTVLGFSSGTFLINNAAYNLTLRGKGTRPNYNNVTLALSSDIPEAVTESTLSGWGFTKNTGTITGVSANGTSVATSGVANIPAASTSAYGVTKLSSATNSTSTTLAATASAVKAAYDLANGKQDKLVSGTNIKTINGASILGSGNITIEGGGNSGANVQAVDTGDIVDDVNVSYATIAYVDGLIGDINSVLESIISGGKNTITFYLYDEMDSISMTAPTNTTWEQFVLGTPASDNGVLEMFSLVNYGSYYAIKCFHNDAMQEMTIYYDQNYSTNVKSTDLITDGTTYYLH